jgi:hypothetical protein
MRDSVYKKKIVDYLKKNLKKSYTAESLKWALVSQGYSRVVIDEALVEANKELASEAPILKEKPSIKYEVMDEQNKPITFNKNWFKKLLFWKK